MALEFANYDEYLTDVLGEIDDCPEIIAVDKIRDTVIELCARTTIWRQDLNPISVQANTPDYELEFDDGQQLAHISWMTLVDANGEETYPIQTSEDEIDAGSSRGWRGRTTMNPNYFYMQDPVTVRLALTPEQSFTMNIGAIIKPTPSSFEAPKFIYDQYHEVVAKGARYRLFNMKGRSWYDPNEAIIEQRDYENGVQDVQNAALKSHGRKAKSVTMRPLA
jgi:hypothetical protein